MYDFPLTGAQKSYLRGLGQKLAPSLKLGKGGLTPAFFAELNRGLRANELVKLRFLGVERAEREELGAKIADEARCVFVGAVGHTALFYRQHPEAPERSIELPSPASPSASTASSESSTPPASGATRRPER